MEIINFQDFLRTRWDIRRVSIIPYSTILGQIQILVGRGAGDIAANRFSDLGGRCREPDTPDEDNWSCAAREFYEESGYTVDQSHIPLTSTVFVWYPDHKYPFARATIWWRSRDFAAVFAGFKPNSEVSELVVVSLAALLRKPQSTLGVLRWHLQYLQNHQVLDWVDFLRA